MNAHGERLALVDAPEALRWDPAELLRQVDGDGELAGELVAIFLEDEAPMRTALRAAIEAGSAEELAHAAHAYKGSAAAVGAVSVAAAAGALEAEGRAGRSSVWFEWRLFENLASRLVEELATFCRP
jgi:HPt (histidine-containing phosphotransfer) domain-containing protein